MAPPPRRRAASAVIAAAIIVVLGNQWRSAFHHLRTTPSSHHPLATFVRDDDARRRRRRGASAASFPAASGDDDDASSSSPSSYILSPMCGGCLRSRSASDDDGNGGRVLYCSQLISRRQKNYVNSSMMAAAAIVGRENRGCELCDPSYCLNSRLESDHLDKSNASDGYRTKYWRFDRSAPRFSNPTTLSLSSIPAQMRIPPERFDDIAAYFEESYDESSRPSRGMDFYLEYNPGLVAVPSKMKPHLPGGTAYLLSMRVTPANNCFSESAYANLTKDAWHALYQGTTNHLGLALLDEGYRMLPGYDVVIDLSSELGLKRPPDKFDSPNFMDYRLFVLDGDIYLHANADTVVVTRLSLRARGLGVGVSVTNGDRGGGSDASEEARGGNDNGRMDRPYRLKNLYGGDELEVTLMYQFNTVWSGGIYGKNYALFAVPDTTRPDAPEAIYAELDITPHHKVQRILPGEYHQLTKAELFERIWKPGTTKRRRVDLDLLNMRAVKEVGNATESVDPPPPPSFATVDEHWFPGPDAPFKEAAHGGACCVEFSAEHLNLGNTKDHVGPLLVGIAHTKVAWKPWYSRKNVPQERKDRMPHTHYVSFVYAFDPRPPFRIRARSGYFCLGHAPILSDGEVPPTEEGGAFNPHSVLTRNRMLQQNNTIFDCPQMHYISSFLMKVGDPSSTVIGYGLNDCTGRLVEVKKEEIVRLLYPDPTDMLFEAT